MTPKQKAIKLETIQNMITIAGFKPDNYENYKRQLKEITYRIKLKPINIRIERKAPENPIWHKVTSQPIVTIDETKLTAWFAKFIQSKEN